MILEKSAEDEVLILNSFGIKIDMAALIDHINSSSNLYRVYEHPTKKLINLNRADGINREILENMGEARLDQPILVTKIDDFEWVIDGNHRLLKRLELKKDSTSYIPINGVLLDPFISGLSWR